jgi:hypothetical protein
LLEPPFELVLPGRATPLFPVKLPFCRLMFEPGDCCPRSDEREADVPVPRGEKKR